MEHFEENIENEYRKRFENFEEMPDDLLWKNIQARIRPEKERPLLIWWNSLGRPVGVAAGLLIGLAIGAYFLIKPDSGPQVSDLPRKPDDNNPHPHKPGEPQKVKTFERSASDIKLSEAVQSKSRKFQEAGSKTNEQAVAVNVIEPDKPLAQETVESNSKTNQLPIAEKTETLSPVVVNAVIPELKQEKPVVVEEKKAEETGAVLAKNEVKEVEKEKQVIPEQKESKPVIHEIPEPPVVASVISADNVSESITRDTLFRDIYILKNKEAQLLLTEKHLSAPELPAQEIPVLPEERSRLVFIPPTEIFANVTSSLSYYMFSPNKGDQILVGNFSNSSQRLGIAAQLGFVYPITRKMDLRTGLSYFTRKSRISYGVVDNSKKSITVLDDNSIRVNPGTSTMNEDRNWQYFELQSDVLYEIKNMQALALGMKLGVQTSSLNAPLVQARLGYRISKAVADHWALWLEPAITVSLSSHHSVENLFMYRTTGFGLNMGVSLLR